MGTVQQVRKVVQALRHQFHYVYPKFPSLFQHSTEKHQLENSRIPKPFLHNLDDATDMQVIPKIHNSPI